MGSRSRSRGVPSELNFALPASRTRSGRLIRPEPVTSMESDREVKVKVTDSELQVLLDNATEHGRSFFQHGPLVHLKPSSQSSSSSSERSSPSPGSSGDRGTGAGAVATLTLKSKHKGRDLTHEADQRVPLYPSLATGPVPAEAGQQDPGILLNTDWSNCGFCASSLAPDEGVMLDMCLHNFCRQCLIDVITVTDDRAKTPCPIAEETRCGGVLSDREVKALVSPKVYEAYVARSLKSAMAAMQDFVACLNPACDAFFSLDDPSIQQFKCRGCGALNCLKCKEIRNDYGHCSCIPKANLVDRAQGKEWAERWGQVEKALSSFGENELLCNTMEFECRICFTDISPGDGVILRECFHMFCKECLSGTIKHCEEVRIKCPHQVNDFICPSFLTSKEVKGLLPEDEFAKFLERSSTQAEMAMENSYHCKTVNCPGWCEVDEEDRKRTKFNCFLCPVCGKKNCLDCKAVHESVSCQEYRAKLHENEMDVQSKQLIQENIKNGLAMRCPTCKVIIEKAIGCDAVLCLMCKTEICWATKGPRWGPKGHGDITGGCRCNVNGQRCHPKCMNCH